VVIEDLRLESRVAVVTGGARGGGGLDRLPRLGRLAVMVGQAVDVNGGLP
jgi:hypothetical protein